MEGSSQGMDTGRYEVRIESTFENCSRKARRMRLYFKVIIGNDDTILPVFALFCPTYQLPR